MSDIGSLLGLAIDKNPVDFADAFNTIVREKAAAALDNRRIELANSIYGANEEPEDEDEVDLDDTTSEGETDEDEGELGDDELDFGELDLDDIDIDLDDLDLNDEGTDEDA